MRNYKNTTEGKNGKLYYGKGTKGGMATQPTTHNSDITKVNISRNNSISPISSDLPDLATTEAALKTAHQDWVNKIKIWHEARNANRAWIKAEQSRLAAITLSTESYELTVAAVNNIEKSDPNIINAFNDKQEAGRLFEISQNLYRRIKLTDELVAKKSKLQSYLEASIELERIMPKVVKQLFKNRKKMKISDDIVNPEHAQVYQENRKQLNTITKLWDEMDEMKKSIDVIEKDIEMLEKESKSL